MDIKFINEKVKSESAKKAYYTLFKKVKEYENIIDKEIQYWNKEDCIEMLSNLGSRKYNTIAVKWSLLKKYLIYIKNNVYQEITKKDLEFVDNKDDIYTSEEIIRNAIENWENNIDKSIIILMRCYGIKPEEMASLKITDIEDDVIKLKDREVKLSKEDASIINNAKNEKGYHMHIDNPNGDKRIAYSYYSYNPENPFFWKNRPNKFNNEGLNMMKKNAIKDKVVRLCKRLNIEGVGSNNLIMNYVVDRILEIEDIANIRLTETQTIDFMEQLKIRCSMYLVYKVKKRMRE